ncbi:MAG TPA: amidase [Gemmatirosa sp.]
MTSPLTRRGFVRAAAEVSALPLLAPLLGAASPAPNAHAPPADVPPDHVPPADADLLEVSVARLHALYAAGRYTPTQVTRWYLDRIARYDDTYRAFIHVDAAGALATARVLEAHGRSAHGALWGVPVIIKSNTSVRGLVTSAGWSGYLIPGRELVAPKDAPVVARLRAAGAIILGQANMPDFAASDANVSTAYGRTGNAYDPRFSPGGSSGGVVTAVTANLCVLGNGTDTGNSIRMPAGTSAVVGLFPTRGLVSIAGIHPLDWLRDNTGPIARTVEDVAAAFDVMVGGAPDAEDFRTREVPATAQRGPYARYLRADALRGRRFGVPAFMLGAHTKSGPWDADLPLRPETRAAFVRALDPLRAAGATVVFDDALLPDAFPDLVAAIQTEPYQAEGVENFLRDYGPAAYHSTAEYAQAVGAPFPAQMRGAGPDGALLPDRRRVLETDPQAEAAFAAPRRRALAAYADALDRFRLDGLVYPAIQMPPNDETADLRAGRATEGPHSATAWVNPLGVPALVVPGGFYANGLPFGLEFAARSWRDGDLLGWGYAYEQATHFRRPPRLVERR